MIQDSIEKLNTEFAEVKKILTEKQEISLASEVENHFRKVLVVAAARHFEQLLTTAIFNFATDVTSEDHPLVNFVQKKGINRQYHTWFDWSVLNANKFFGLFGNKFKQYMISKVRDDIKLDTSIRAFLRLGRDRNLLVHEDYVSMPVEETSNDIFERYKNGKLFVEIFPIELNKFINIENR